MTQHDDLPDDAKRDLSISMAKANLYGILLLIPGATVLAVPYILLWGWSAFGDAWRTISDNLLLALAILAVGVVVHEIIHGLAWRIFGKKPREAITYGFQLKTLTPYAHCTEPMAASAYRLGAAMPGLTLGIIPWLTSLVTGDGPMLLFGLVFTLAALGDAMILWLLRSVAPDVQVIDHPTRAGCYVVESET